MFFLPKMLPKVISVEYELPPFVIPYIESRHSDFVELFGADMMDCSDRSTDRIWYLERDWKCLLVLNVGFLECEFKRGWWLDWQSIPGAAESFEARDDRQGIVGGTIHDGLFAVQYPHFDAANSIYYQIMRLEGTPRIRAWYKWAAVQSAAGRMAWNESSFPLKLERELKWVKINEVPVISQSFRHLLGAKHASR